MRTVLAVLYAEKSAKLLLALKVGTVEVNVFLPCIDTNVQREQF